MQGPVNLLLFYITIASISLSLFTALTAYRYCVQAKKKVRTLEIQLQHCRALHRNFSDIVKKIISYERTIDEIKSGS